MQTENPVFNPVQPQPSLLRCPSKMNVEMHVLVQMQCSWAAFKHELMVLDVVFLQFVMFGSHRVKHWICLKHYSCFGKFGPFF